MVGDWKRKKNNWKEVAPLEDYVVLNYKLSKSFRLKGGHCIKTEMLVRVQQGLKSLL